MSALQATWRAPPPSIASVTFPRSVDRLLPLSPIKRRWCRGIRVKARGDDGHRWSSEPVGDRSVVEEGSGGPEVSAQARMGGKFKFLWRRRPLWRRLVFASRKVRSVILLNVLSVVYASNIPVIKEIEAIVDPAFFNMVRFVLSVVPFIPFMYQNQDHQTRSNGIELGCWVSLGYLSQALGLLTSDAGRASFLSAFTVIVVPLIDGLFGVTVPPLTWLGAVLSLVGVAILECGGSPPSVGDLLNLLSAVFFGIHIFRTEHISRTTKKSKVFALLGYEVCVVALFSALWFCSRGLFGDAVIGGSSPSWKWVTAWDWIVSFPWIPAFYTGVFSTGLCLWAEMSAMCDVSATETAIIYGLEPLWGASFAWFFLGERWSAIGWLGAALLLVGSLTVQIFGSASVDRKQREGSGTDHYQLDKKQSNLSFSTVIISPGKNSRNLIKKNKENCEE